MGVHDYVDFIQRNGQDIFPLSGDENSTGASHAILVLIPKKHTKRDILSWTLTEFQKFHIKEVGYSWDDWDFEEVEGYRELLLDDHKWWDVAIWESPTIPNTYIVNFEPETYKAFVLGQEDSNKISKRYYKTVFGNRDVDMPDTKALAYEKIINSGSENLWEYDGNMLLPLTIPAWYSELRLNLPVLNDIFVYKLQTPPNLTKGRLAILIKDNVKSSTDLVIPITHATGLGETTFCKTYDPNGISTYYFQFIPNIPIDIKAAQGCLKCGNNCWTGLYTCLNHKYYNTSELKAEIEGKISDEAEQSRKNLITLQQSGAPEVLTCDFTEKDVYYHLILTLHN